MPTLDPLRPEERKGLRAAMEKALDSAMARATVSVPLAKASNSNTPTGPFHTTVPAALISSAYCAAVCGPMSRIMSPAPTWSTGLTVAGASAAKAGATTTSTGSGIRAPRAWASAAIFFAVSTRSGSYSDLPTSWPAAAMKVLAMPPPTISWSTLSTRLVSSSSLVETLLPATIASSGRAGLSRALASASSSAISSGPPAATGAKRITPWVEAWARCAVPKASITNTSHSAAYCFDNASSSLPSPRFMRQFSSNTSWPGRTSTPSR